MAKEEYNRKEENDLTQKKVMKRSKKALLQQEWVFNQNGQVLTDSLTVAMVFGKEHKSVLRDIRNLVKSIESGFAGNNFVPSTYKSAQNKELQKYILTEDGFTLLVMGYTGVAAMRFKVEYINRFRALKEQLQASLPGAVKAYMGLSENERAIKFFEQRLKLEHASKELKEAKPKVEFHDKFVEAEGYQSIGELAKVLGTGRTRLFRWLRTEGFLTADNVPYQRHIEEGHFLVKERTRGDRTGSFAITQTYVTPKGVTYIAKKYLEAGCPAN